MSTRMSTRIPAGITALVAAGALAVPATSLAKVHHPHRHKVLVACPTHKRSGKHKGATKGRKKGSIKGKKCYVYVG
jgi:hypothetical protein